MFCLEPSPTRRSTRNHAQIFRNLPEDHNTTPGQSRSSRRKRTINYNDQDDEDLDLVPSPLLQENNHEFEELGSDDTVNMLVFLLYF